MKRTVIRYGLFSGLVILVLFAISMSTLGSDYGTREVVGYSSMIISLLFVFFGIKHYRDRENDGRLTFGQGMKVGVLIALIPSLIFGIFNLVYVTVIDPNFIETYYQYQMNQMQQTMSATEFQAARTKMESQKEMFSNPAFGTLVMFLTVFVIGVIITVISSLILRRSDNTGRVRSAVAS